MHLTKQPQMLSKILCFFKQNNTIEYGHYTCQLNLLKPSGNFTYHQV
jgi:hypothetical protein